MYKRKWFIMLFASLLAVVLVLSLLPGCAQTATTPAPASTTAKPVTTVTATQTVTTTATQPASTTAAATTTTAATQSAADFYKGKNITLVCPLGAGGGADLQGRIAGSFLGPLTGANAGVINDTGASGLVARNNLFKATKADGLTIMVDAAGTICNWLLDSEGVQYDASKFEYLGAIKCAVSGVVVSAKGPYTTVDALKAAKGLKFGSTSPATLPTMSVIAAISILNLDAKIATGYPSVSARRLALEQAEVAAIGNTIDTASLDAAGGKSKVLFAIAEARDKNFPDIPAIAEYKTLTDQDKKLIASVPNDYKMFFAPPGTPKDRVEFLRANFAKVFADKGFQSGVTSISGFWQGSLTGQELQDYVTSLSNNKTEYLKLYKDLFNKYVIQ